MSFLSPKQWNGKGMGSTISIPLAITVGAAVIGSVVVGKAMMHQYRRQKDSDATKSDENVMSIKMTDLEKSFYFNDLPYITTVTWFKGDYKNATQQLEHRMKLLLDKNPWLRGRLALRSGSRWKTTLYLSYFCDDIGSSKSMEDHLEFVDSKDSPISRDAPIGEIGNFLKDYMLKNNTKEPLFKATIIPCSKNPSEKFAVMVQMSHVVGDGATYYSLLRMLFSLDESNIIKLNSVRNMKSREQQIAAMGKDEAEFLGGYGDMVNIIRGALASVLSSTPLVFQFGMVDSAKMEAAKLAAAKKGAVPFVSSNDVITSWFLQQVHTNLGYMLINWRNRLEGHSELDAGNYENAIFYRKEDSASPAHIRKSLKTFQRTVTKDEKKVPGVRELMSGPGIAIVTNWSTFAKKNEIKGCEEEFHVPASSISLFPTTMPLLLIFRAGVDQLGLCYFHTTGVNHLEYAPFLKEDYRYH